MVHSFTCAGILPSQYIHFSKFAGIGVVGHVYINHGMFLSYFLSLCIYYYFCFLQCIQPVTLRLLTSWQRSPWLKLLPKLRHILNIWQMVRYVHNWDFIDHRQYTGIKHFLSEAC